LLPARELPSSSSASSSVASAVTVIPRKEIQQVAKILPAETPPPIDTPKKESRLKHFFSPIRKKVPQPQITPVASSQADLFVTNIVPNNLPIQQQPMPSNDFPLVKELYPSSSGEISNPVHSSFQVRG
jgi:hypothetical protein